MLCVTSSRSFNSAGALSKILVSPDGRESAGLVGRCGLCCAFVGIAGRCALGAAVSGLLAGLAWLEGCCLTGLAPCVRSELSSLDTRVTLDVVVLC